VNWAVSWRAYIGGAVPAMRFLDLGVGETARAEDQDSGVDGVGFIVEVVV